MFNTNTDQPMKENESRLLSYKRRNRDDNTVNEGENYTTLQETELVLKLKKEELFDPHVLLPHAELNSIVYNSVDTFVEKYKGTDMTLSICTDSVNLLIQDSFREVYLSHYREELLKVNKYLKRHFIRGFALIMVGVIAFLVSRLLTKYNPNETILSYILLNMSGFCLWEVGYTQFATRNVVDERKRITRALNAKIEFQ